MLNVVAHETDYVGGVLFRAIEPTIGIDVMQINRISKNLINLTNGPGKLSVALDITRDLNGNSVTDVSCDVAFYKTSITPSIASSHRIGVARDLSIDLRFYVRDNPYISKH